VAVADRLALAVLEQQRHVLAPQLLVLHHVTPFNAHGVALVKGKCCAKPC
jgi:hypothetical protein